MAKTNLKKMKIGVIISAVFIILIGTFFTLRQYGFFEKTKPIPIAMALDDGYLYPTIVSITSMMENSHENTNYDFYIMHPGNFKEESKERLKSLGKKYNRCHINLINMESEYSTAYDKGHITTPAYYRLSLSELLPKLDKMLWIDGDTLIFDDLHEMYNLKLNDNYYLGYLDDRRGALKEFGLNDDNYICDGVMVVNLKKLRDDNMVSKFKKFIEQYNDKLVQHDQTVINAVCNGKLGTLPPIYGLYNYYENAQDARNYSTALVAENKYTPDEMEYAFNNLVLLHCVHKPWKSTDCNFSGTWWAYAEKTDFFDEIHNAYPIF